MMGLAQGSPSQGEIIAMALKTALPDEAARTLTTISDELANLASARNDFAAARAQIDAARAANDKFAAELNERAAKLEDDGAALRARADRLAEVIATFEKRLAASLEQTS